MISVPVRAIASRTDTILTRPPKRFPERVVYLSPKEQKGLYETTGSSSSAERIYRLIHRGLVL